MPNYPETGSIAAATWATCSAAWSPCGRRTGRQRRNISRRSSSTIPNDFGARNNLALALVEQDDPAKKQRALDYAEANYRDNKDNPDALSTLGWVYFRRE